MESGGSSPLRLIPLSKAWVPALRAFHHRLEVGGGPSFRFGEDFPDGDRPTVNRRSTSTTWLAVEGDAVRGGIMTHELEFETPAGRVPVINIQLPLSEGTVDRKFAHVGMWLIREIQRKQPRVYAVGMGGEDQPLPRLLRALKWTVVSVPFFFYVHRPRAVLAGLPMLRRRSMVRAACQLAAHSGGGLLAVRLAQTFTARGKQMFAVPAKFRVAQVNEWDQSASDVWRDSRARYSLAAVREGEALQRMYNAADRQQNFTVKVGTETVGWFTVLVTHMRDSAYFGNLTVGTVLDVQSLPGHEHGLVAAARQTLQDMNVDLSVTNQMHADWQRAFLANGYWSRPSNYVFAASPQLIAAGGTRPLSDISITRGDGDGRIHL